MNTLSAFSLPVKGLKNGLHEFVFDIDKTFFAAFEGSQIEDADVRVMLEFDKQSALFDMRFTLKGVINTACDRCTAPIALPIADEQQLTVKISDELREEEADAIFLHPEAHEINVAQYIYEFISLAVPNARVYNCQDEPTPPCDFAALAVLENQNAANDGDETTDDDPKENPFSDIKRLFGNDN